MIGIVVNIFIILRLSYILFYISFFIALKTIAPIEKIITAIDYVHLDYTKLNVHITLKNSHKTFFNRK